MLLKVRHSLLRGGNAITPEVVSVAFLPAIDPFTASWCVASVRAAVVGAAFETDLVTF